VFNLNETKWNKANIASILKWRYIVLWTNAG